MTEYERLSLLALAEILDALNEMLNPGQVSLGFRRREVSDDIRAAAVEEEAPGEEEEPA